MKYIYDWSCRTACITAVLVLGNITEMNRAFAQPPTVRSNAGYIPVNVGKIMPNDNYPDNSINPRDKTRYVYDGNNSMTRLPHAVTLRDLYLTATANDGIVIRWRTNWEPENLKLYEIEYSTDGIHFQQAGVLAAGNYLNGRIYEFRHFPVNVRDRMFYRVRIMAQDGRFNYSPMLSQAANGSTQNYVFPTIVNSGMVSLYLNDTFRTLQIVNMEGRILQTQILNGNTGRIDFPLNTAARGICFVRVLGDNRQRDIVQKIFIQ